MKKLFLLLIVLFIPVTVGGGCSTNRSITKYKIDCALEENVVKGVEEVDFFNHSDNAFAQLKFNLFANAFRENATHKPISTQYYSKAYYNGKSYGQIDIKKVYNKNGDLEFVVCGEDENVLQVNLDKEVFPNERVSVIIEYEITLPNVIARTGINKNTINLANFYPVLCAIDNGSFYECVYYANGDPYYSDCADYQVTFTCDGEYVIATSGKIISSENAENKVTNRYELENARSFAMVLSKQFEVVSDKCGETEISYYYYDDIEPLTSLKCAVDSVKYFNQTFGEYPYSTYSVVQTEFVQGGMEFPALVMISAELENNAYNEVIVHETAHQWWQTVVGNNEIEYGFLDEGLAEYSVVLFYENHPDYGVEKKTLINQAEKTYKVFCSVYDKLFGKVNTVMKRSLKDFNSEYEYVNLAYIKPCIMYDNLRNTVGDGSFFKALKSYYKNYAYKNATPDELVGEFEKQVGDISKYFNSFFEGKVIL